MNDEQKKMGEIIWHCMFSGHGFSLLTMAFTNRDGTPGYQATSIDDAVAWAKKNIIIADEIKKIDMES
jgi:hypothetical protein